MIKKYLYTIWFLKPIQIYYRLFYFLKKKLSGDAKLLEGPSKGLNFPVLHADVLINQPSYLKENQFKFLNLSHKFQENIDWNFNGFGKLWTYNLCYFDFLLQSTISVKEGLSLLYDFHSNYHNIKDGKEPYPSSLRVMNCIKFIATNQIKDKKIEQLIYSDYKIVLANLEYHLMGNHLLENAFAILYGAIYFKDKKGWAKACELLKQELEEQVLEDGAHFELTPMYHQIILTRLLDSMNLLMPDHTFDSSEMIAFFNKKASIMLGWLLKVSFSNGEIPMFNDSTKAIAPSTSEIEAYAAKLSITAFKKKLTESTYRKESRGDYEWIMKTGEIKANYIPGHAHSDLFTFALNYKGKALIVDTGVSTYEKNEIRHKERSTSSHNTVIVKDRNQIDVWGGFRVAGRVKVEEEQITNMLTLRHNGYKKYGVKHQRSFLFQENRLIITDTLSKTIEAKAFIHFHPNENITENDGVIRGDFGRIEILGHDDIRIKKYNFAEEFNLTKESLLLEVSFKKELITEIYFK